MSEVPGAIVLLSGGLDSATLLAMARHQGYAAYALSFDYGQRHITELRSAKNIAAAIGVEEHKVLNIDLAQLGGSALTDQSIAVPEKEQEGIPVTYVPARNTIFLAFALAYAEVIKAEDIFIGVTAVDYSGYPDCRPEYIASFEKMARLATRAGVEGAGLNIHTPLIELSKANIIKCGLKLGVDYALTISCYQADDTGRACGVCDSCRLRKVGFAEAQVADPTHYQ